MPPTPELYSPSVLSAPVTSSVPPSAPSVPVAPANRQRPVHRRGQNRKPLPPVPRIPRDQKTPMVEELLSCIRKHRVEATRVRCQLEKKTNEIKILKAHSEESVLGFLEDKVSPGFFKLLRCEVRNFKRKPQGRRFEAEEKLMFNAMRNRGPSGYNELPWIKPTKKTLKATFKKLN